MFVIPSPIATATKAYFFFSTTTSSLFSSLSLYSSFDKRTSLCSSLILSILILDNSPNWTALANTAPGSLVWICTFITSSYPTTTCESPIGIISFLKLSALLASAKIINSVQ